MRALHALLALGVLGVGLVAACGDDAVDSAFQDPNAADASVVDPPILPIDGSLDLDAQTFAITPPDPVVTFTGLPAATVQFVATASGGSQVPAVFSLDRGEIGSVTTGGLFTASGKVGGKATVSAEWNGKKASTSVTVKLAIEQNGETVTDAGSGGAGGNGGVGGEGPGGAVDAGTMTVLKGAPTADTGLAFLYPYDKTVWPRGILAPLLQWKPGAQASYDAVRITITENAFTYDGYFAKTATPFTHHPIPQAAWKQMLLSNGGEDVTVTLTFAKGGVAYGPITEKWKVASAPLKGIVYYNSYGTRLAKNYGGAVGGDGMFGAATLAIRGNSTDPALVAGSSGSADNCRVCHSVAANGSKLITQRNVGGQRKFSTYDLKTGAETIMSPENTQNANYAWPAIYPDGTMFLGDSSSGDGSSNQPNKLYDVPSGAGPVTPAAVATTGWPGNFRAAYPAFSPDGKHLAFTMFANATGADQKTLAYMTFDNVTKAFGPLTQLLTPAGGHAALFPSFLPTNDGVVFHVETRYNGRDYGGTRSDGDSGPQANVGTRAELWWMDLKTKTATRLDVLNGKGYLPVNAATQHDDDATLNYEPTVNPVPSGGYAWVVFTSRRLYGNIATINPHWSDPRNFDLNTTPTPKKLWVAAIDLNAPPGTDPSHPAFYLPAQELLAGNSRGYWVVDPCKSDGNTCETGDECCGGFCRPGDGGLVCTAQAPTCAQEFEKCSVDADCCNSAAYKCINGRCALPAPK
jgi:WD40-like Beta Propeller Repeat